MSYTVRLPLPTNGVFVLTDEPVKQDIVIVGEGYGRVIYLSETMGDLLLPNYRFPVDTTKYAYANRNVRLHIPTKLHPRFSTRLALAVGQPPVFGEQLLGLLDIPDSE